ncbi:predicted protein [Chaetoceros tenuissimus]|uniref:Uncharacterized protein n=1 Tax=Chaetoceros tenuissimus TaxID=426638 RepID=A0AAD3D786_9STRA|nr:predicted protein [Chaetoceros tenuissimus]
MENHNKNKDQAYRDEIKAKIAAFEARLYKCAPTLELHRDSSTLESRVKLLALQLGQKLERRNRNSKRNKLSHTERASIFNSSECNSKPSFDDVREIVENVKMLRKNGYVNMRMREEGEICRGHSCLVTSQTRCNAKFISVAMKNIYFRTRLVEAFEKIFGIQTKDAVRNYIKDVNWKMLIEEAKDSIYHFERWERVQVGRMK